MQNQARAVYPVKGAAFARFLKQRYFECFAKGASPQALQDALDTIEAEALFKGERHEVYLRVANLGDRIYLDLCDDQWRVVEVTAAGWRVMPHSPVMFTRTREMLALPEPIRESVDALPDIDSVETGEKNQQAGIGRLKSFVNVEAEDFPLIYGFLLGVLRGLKPYPVLILQGESGTGKTTTSTCIKQLVDPTKAAVMFKPKDDHDLLICAANQHVVAIDNLSGLSKDLSDKICSISTGAGDSRRKLYTNHELETVQIARPVILNGIDDIATRGDLLNRSLEVNLPVLPIQKRYDEAAMQRQFEASRPVMLGALLDMLAGGLREYEQVGAVQTGGRFVGLPRFVTAAERAVGMREAFAQTYDGNALQAVMIALEASPLACALRQFMLLKTRWEGFAGELFEQLNNRFGYDSKTGNSTAWPKTAHDFSAKLNRLAPQLRQAGLDVQGKRTKDGKRIILENIRKSASSASSAVIPLPCKTSGLKGSVTSPSPVVRGSVINRQEGVASASPAYQAASTSVISESRNGKADDAGDADDALFLNHPAAGGCNV